MQKREVLHARLDATITALRAETSVGSEASKETEASKLEKVYELLETAWTETTLNDIDAQLRTIKVSDTNCDTILMACMN